MGRPGWLVLIALFGCCCCLFVCCQGRVTWLRADRFYCHVAVSAEPPRHTMHSWLDPAAQLVTMHPCRFNAANEEIERLRAAVAAKEGEVREAKQAEQEFAAECERLDRDFTAERQKLMVGGWAGGWAGGRRGPTVGRSLGVSNLLSLLPALLTPPLRFSTRLWLLHCPLPPSPLLLQAEVASARQDQSVQASQATRLREEVGLLKRQYDDAKRNYDHEVMQHGDALKRYAGGGMRRQ